MMTSPNTNPTPNSPEPKAESFLDWFHVNSRLVYAAAFVVAAAVVGTWYVSRANAMKNANADRQLLTAKQSIASGNTQLAEADLKKVADRYQGTSAGTEAALLLGRLKLEKGDAQGAAAYLKTVADGVKGGPAAASTRGLLGDAYAQLDKPADAAAEYERAAAATTMPNERMYLLTKAGHAYMAAGKLPEARKVWEAVAQSDNPAAASEARVRLGELSASAAKG
jgi:predicted negative regulator of RcsB-dependent stress response